MDITLHAPLRPYGLGISTVMSLSAAYDASNCSVLTKMFDNPLPNYETAFEEATLQLCV